MIGIICSNCGQPYPESGIPFRCQKCTGIFDWPVLPPFDPSRLEPGLPGVWCYRHTFGLPGDIQPVTLGEGKTPLIWGRAFNQTVGYKSEFLNPSGSYKDRGTAVLVAYLRSKNVLNVIEDSSGNAGASLAAYSARAGISARVFIPESASGPKKRQIEAYGATIEIIAGARSNAAEAVSWAANETMVYASHAYLPHVLAGYATLAYELYEELGGAPGTVVLPVGQGNLLLGIGRGFQSLQRSGLIDKIPFLLGVQARACAPLWAVSQYGTAGLSWIAEGETLAEGVRVKHPVRGDAVLNFINQAGGALAAVDEDEILTGRDALARQGLYVEPTSALVWGALKQFEHLPAPVIVVLTGSGLKAL